MRLSAARFLRPHCSNPGLSNRFAALKATIAVLCLGASVAGYAQDEVRTAVDDPATVELRTTIAIPPTLRRHVMLPSTVHVDSDLVRTRLASQATVKVQPRAVKTGTGIVYTCDSTVPASTCTYLNTTVAGYYNNVFTNANANIYIKFGDTGLGASDGFYNLVHYTPYVTSLTNNTGKSGVQTSALASINKYATPVYGTQNIMDITVALGSVLGFQGLIGINAAETASCTPYTSGCYNEVITVANASQQASGGFTFYYDNEGGTETASQFDFYGVVMHETDEVLGTSSCISTDGATLVDGCDGPAPTGSNGIPSPVDLDRFLSPGVLAKDTTPSTAAGQYFSWDGGVTYGAYGYAGNPKVYNTVSNGQDFADYLYESDCAPNIAVQDAVGCIGNDQGLTVLDDGQSEFIILNTIGFNVPEAAITSPAAGSTLSGTSETFTWKAASGATDYELWVSKVAVGDHDIYDSGEVTATSEAVTGLPTSGTVYVRVWSLVGGFWTYVDYTYTGGTATAPAISFSPTSLTFASTTVGSTTAAQAVTIKNTGTATLTLTSESITGTNASSFIKSATTCGSTLAAGYSCTVSIEFKPTAAQTLTADLSVSDNVSGSPQTVTLTGKGTAPTTPTVTLTPTSLTFPTTVVGVASDAQIVTLKNTGTLGVTISSIALGGTNPTSFQQIGTCGATLAAGASCSIYVAFDPTSAAALTGTLSVTDNATGSPQKVTLAGTGTAAPSVTLSTKSITFPTTKHGTTSAAQAVTLTNAGKATLVLTSIVLAGANPTDFEELNTCGATLAPAATCTVYVAFKPAAAAAYKATVVITDSGAASPQSIALAGTGS